MVILMSNWDIFQMKDEDGWFHHQIMYRLQDCNIDHLFADIWYGEDMAYIVGCKASPEEVADALNLHADVIYEDPEHCIMILNLFQEKFIRGYLN